MAESFFRSMLVASLVLAPSPASAAPLQPNQKWIVDYGDTQCTAARTFGEGSKLVGLAVVPSINGLNYDLIVSDARSGPHFAEEVMGTLDFRPGKKVTSWLLRYALPGEHKTIYQYRIAASDFERARESSEVEFRSQQGDSFDLSVSDMPALLEAMKSCTADLQKYWNFGDLTAIPEGPPRQAPITPAKPPRGDVRKLFTGDDYPGEATNRGQQGTAQYQLLIDEKGNVAGCDVLRQSGIPALDIMGCQVLQTRAKFTPATNAQGLPVRAVVTTPPITWRMEG